ncbi:lipoprotein-anchoring transpeptidase ErfK/SrfK [Catenulispora sp. MAP12-49]|uniref:hypothetical protein n=1 Tax=unclassified Catenulispora TaxID=414885 RepID=UPI00351692F7
MDVSLLEAFEPVAHDLRAAGLDCQLAEDPNPGEPAAGATAVLIVSGVKVGRLTLGASVLDTASRTLYLAAQTQRLVQGNLSIGGRVIEWPPCLPSHAHPMMATRGQRAPLWTCPLGGDVSVPIGRHP